MNNEITNTKEFLAHFPQHVIQIFDDTPEKRNYMAWSDVPNKDYHLQVAYEDQNRRGAGIFFSVNKFPGGKRKKELCTGINAWFCESDTLTKSEQWDIIATSPLQPHLIVGSKKSLHCYWLADASATRAGFIPIQLGLAKYFQGDTAMKDIARVLRVPGYYHMKDPEHPSKVVVHQDFTMFEPLYSEAEMLKAFPYEMPPPKEPYVSRWTKPSLTDDETFWDVLSSLNSKQMLEMLSGDFLVNFETFTFRPRSSDTWYIYVNGKPADAWIDKAGLIGSPKHGGPTWIQWVRWYGASYAEIACWAKSKFMTS